MLIMDKARFIFIIETEAHLTMLSRLTQLFSRSRVSIDELQAIILNDVQRFTITVSDTKESACRLFRKIDGQVDVISVNLFEQINYMN